eukprot:TRINITY_DN780251_c0_g1_i1.p1 TRINITY_DN780251_c0_g1~~TRINITY_DN780251_c0_g1_i1.p1  ORF type:complete len:347 (+),score=94.22 TRINITY_DN780251_c0_g1_i1:39-1079(+)
MDSTIKCFFGVEGGATNTTVALVEENGKILSQKAGGPSNHFTIGMQIAAQTIVDLCKQILLEIDGDITILGMGMAMSGFGEEKYGHELIDILIENNICDKRENMHVFNDSVGSAFVAHEDGGIVLISGTGSIANAVFPNYFETKDASCRAGGHGHLISDKGSAFWASQTAISRIFEGMDGMFMGEGISVETAADKMFKYFELTKKEELYPLLYQHFDKAKIAGFCRCLAEEALKGDQFCLEVFADVGVELGKLITSIIPKWKEGSNGSDEMRLICIGSVWKSYQLFKESFFNIIHSSGRAEGLSCRLVRVSGSSAAGAAYVAAKFGNFNMNMKRDSLVDDIDTLEF